MYIIKLKEIGAARKRFPNPSDSTLIDFGDDVKAKMFSSNLFQENQYFHI